jgi:hypothetical protein
MAEQKKTKVRQQQGNNLESPPIHYVDTSTPVTNIIEWSQSEEKVVFDWHSLPELSQETLEQLREEDRNAYYAQIGRREQAKKVAHELEYEHEIKVEDSLLDTLGGNAGRKLEHRKRKGWHQTWKRPDEFDDAQEYGFRPVRENKEGENREPGYERGPVRKIPRHSDTPELIEMEIPEDVYMRHLMAVGHLSRSKYQAHKENFHETMKRSFPQTTVYDDEEHVGQPTSSK